MARKVTIPDDTVDASLDTEQEANTQKSARADKRNDELTKDLLYGKDAYKRTVTDTMQERDRRGAYLHSFGTSKKIVMEWDINDDAIRDQVFKLTIGKETAYLSAVELQKYLRWV